MESAAGQATEATGVRSSRALERATGWVMLAYMLTVAGQVFTRTASTGGADTSRAYLEAIAANYPLYLASLSAGLASSILLIALAGGLWYVLHRHHSYLALTGSFLFLAAAVTWVISASGGLALASLAREFAAASGAQAGVIAGSAHAVELIREASGRAGFTLAALGLLAVGGLLAWRMPLPRWLGWLGIAVGLLMLFIWLDSAAMLHRIGGTGYLLWLLAAGIWLVARGARPAPAGG